MPDIVFFIKNQCGEYVSVNQTLVTRCGKRHKSELLGRSPGQVLGEDLGRGYEEQDRRVLASGQRLLDSLELHMYANGTLGWCLTSKIPLMGQSGEPVGLVGVSRDLRLPDLSGDDFAHIADAVAYAQDHLEAAPGNAELASIAKMSPYQLDRRMKQVFGMTTGQWLLKNRITQASRLLLETALPIVEVAFATGYTDQSAFTRQFRRATGVTPSQFRGLRGQAEAGQ